jgi:rhodanese-related sulfurtransferase
VLLPIQHRHALQTSSSRACAQALRAAAIKKPLSIDAYAPRKTFLAIGKVVGTQDALRRLQLRCGDAAMFKSIVNDSREFTMKYPTLKSLFALLTALLAATAFSQNADKQPASKARELSNAEFEQLLVKPESLTIIDLRRPDELTKIGGFPVYLSIQIADLEKSLAWIPKDRTIVTVSNHAARSGRAADLLASKGFKVAGTVGAQTYEERGGKLTKIVAPPPRNRDAQKQVAGPEKK